MKFLEYVNHKYDCVKERLGMEGLRNHAGDLEKKGPKKHIACVFLLDISESMNYPKEHRPIDSLNLGLQMFKEQICCDQGNRDFIDVSVVTFGMTAKVVSPFCPVVDFIPPVLHAEGCTAMGAGLSLAISQAQDRMKWYEEEGMGALTPWVILITDGVPTDSVIQVKREMDNCSLKKDKGQVKLWVVASENADLRFCKCLTKRVIWLEDQDYTPIFDWMRKSMEIVTKSSSATGHILLPKLPDHSKYIPQDW